MCIRDSIYAVGRDGLAKRKMSDTSTTLEPLFDYILEHVKPCLLYTSDAADERSSVDLGGRRIIKKKK